MVNLVIGLATAQALLRLRLRPLSRCWWQPFKREERIKAIHDYLIAVCRAHSDAMLLEDPLPDEEGSERRLTEAIEHALRAANDPEVASVAASFNRMLADIWRRRYMDERARRRREWLGLAGLPDDAFTQGGYEAEARAELAWRRKEPESSEIQAQEVQTPHARPEKAPDEERQRLIEYRKRLLDEYKAATGASERAIYNARGSGGHTCRKADFYAWKKGELPASSTMAQSLERFLQAKNPPPKSKKQQQ